MSLPNKPLTKAGVLSGAAKPQISSQLLEKARANAETVLRELESRLDGLSQAENLFGVPPSGGPDRVNAELRTLRAK